MKKKSIFTIAGMTVFLGLTSLVGNYLIDKHIEESIKKIQIMPHKIITIFPGKTDKSIDLFFENMEDNWNKTPRGEKTYFPSRVLDFTKLNRPERLEEAYGLVIDFLDKKGFRNHVGFFSEEYEMITGNDIFVKKYKK